MFEKLKNFFNRFDIDKLNLEEIKSESIQIDRESERIREGMRQKSESRATLFSKAVESTDDLESESIAIKIENIEGEQANLYNEHVELMNALRTMNGLKALKQNQKILEKFGIWGKIKSMDPEKIKKILGDTDAEKIISGQNSDDISRLFGVTPARVSSKKTEDIMKQIKKAKVMREEKGLDSAVKEVLKERDTEIKKKSDEKIASFY